MNSEATTHTEIRAQAPKIDYVAPQVQDLGKWSAVTLQISGGPIDFEFGMGRVFNGKNTGTF